MHTQRGNSPSILLARPSPFVSWWCSASWAGMFSSYILLTLSLVTLASPTLDPSLVALYENLSVISMTGVIIFFAFGPGCIAW